ncbi:hypothetical protein CLV79_1045 [Limimaricola soesokkakensis]|uniref:Uncharacterized protein n=1 Tax=Limimaricola soesokkakensis TaxID=1343159 RepID=A0A1X6Z8X8_9RHOB|nr:hypothetical protein [Limimaricola soesokkakensis]PSK86576.1 hypothetical protein CLV79_1045 [Limimaricola soesokkakensis]SLN43992.1 hypothetical protein LOS8367_01946 [Limimaricola soesokkakensis]
MSPRTPTTAQLSSIEALAAHALAQSRIALPHLRGNSAVRLHGGSGQLARSIADAIERREIFEAAVAWDLHELVEDLNDEIGRLIVQVANWSDDECDVSGLSWIETYWPPEALRLATLRGELSVLRDAIDAVIDRRDLDQILASGRRRTAQLARPANP